jgi:hypothetical protein
LMPCKIRPSSSAPRQGIHTEPGLAVSQSILFPHTIKWNRVKAQISQYSTLLQEHLSNCEDLYAALLVQDRSNEALDVIWTTIKALRLQLETTGEPAGVPPSRPSGN